MFQRLSPSRAYQGVCTDVQVAGCSIPLRAGHRLRRGIAAKAGAGWDAPANSCGYAPFAARIWIASTAAKADKAEPSCQPDNAEVRSPAK